MWGFYLLKVSAGGMARRAAQCGPGALGLLFFRGRGGLQKNSWPRLLLADFRMF